MNCTHATASVTTGGGGVPESLCQLVCAQAVEGISTRVIGFDDGRPAIVGWPVNALHALVPARSIGFPWAGSFFREIVASQPAILHTHGLWMQPSLVVPKAAREKKLPWIVSPHGMLDPWALSNSPWKKRLAAVLFENHHLRGAACLHALCQSEAEAVRTYGLKNPICLIPNGVTVPEFRRPEIGVSEARSWIFGDSAPRISEVGKLQSANPVSKSQHFPPLESPNVPLSAFDSTSFHPSPLRSDSTIQDFGFSAFPSRVLLFLGRLHPKKGLVNALRAWKEAMGKAENWQFVIAGWDQGGHGEELKRLCKELGLSYSETPGSEFSTKNEEPSETRPTERMRSQLIRGTKNGERVAFVGPVFGDEKDALLRRADAFILPSFSEGLPMAVLEAWAYGLPVLMTDHCNLPEGFRDGAALRIGTDPESIAEGMRELFQGSCQDLETMGANGRTLVEERFTWPKVAAQMKEVYEWMVGGGGKPGSVL